MKKKGCFITFEGGEGAGKTTLVEKIALYLKEQNYPFLKTREPGGTLLGEEIRATLLKLRSESISSYAELCLFLASRAQHIFELIHPALQQGKIVLCDRFNDSSVVYQGAARGLGTEKVARLCHLATGLEPDLTIYLDIDPEVGLARATKNRALDRIEREEIAFHRKIREAYLQLSRENPKRFFVIDANKTSEKVYSQALEKICSLLGVSCV
jgi:dTMP kinase